MEKSLQPVRPHLFVLRLWSEDLGDGSIEWRGEIESVPNRDKRYFREWAVLLGFVQRSCSITLDQTARADDFPSSETVTPTPGSS